MLCTYYRGRSSFLDMMNLPLSYINSLYAIAIQRQKIEQCKIKENEAIEDGLEDMM